MEIAVDRAVIEARHILTRLGDGCDPRPPHRARCCTARRGQAALGEAPVEHAHLSQACLMYNVVQHVQHYICTTCIMSYTVTAYNVKAC